MAPIRNAVEILRLMGSNEPTLAAALDMIERQVTHMVRLVDDLLDVSRVSRGKIQLQKKPLDLAEVVQQAVETSRKLIEARRHELSVTLPEEPIRIEGDFTRLAQVVLNLLDNAAKYTDKGGKIWLTVEKTLETAVIRIRDTGRGIDATALKSLFDLFFQADRNLDRSDGGLGIGLSLVKSLVQMHDGTVEAHSAGRGKGSEFVVCLPCMTATSVERSTEKAVAPVTPSSRLRILVVDDLRDSANSMALLLQLEGHEVLTAHDGRQAVEIALRERPDVVLLDIGLPELNGYQACKAMREGGLAETLIVAMTGYGQDQDRRRSQQAGFDAHLVKPLDLLAIRELLARRARGEQANT
jgi:CheY-like chemotaxis protein/anti-sigma regulatory factor (Ser/Thr protein kinase)